MYILRISYLTTWSKGTKLHGLCFFICVGVHIILIGVTLLWAYLVSLLLQPVGYMD